MKCNHPYISRFFFGVAALLLLGGTPVCALEVALVVHPEVQVGQLSPEYVRLIFLGKKSTWEDGSKIVPVIQGESPLTAEFIEEVLDLTPKQYYLYWRKALFTGQGIPPVEVANDEQMKQVILQTPGSIGFLSVEALGVEDHVVPVR